MAKETHEFGAEVGKILQLMIHSLYAHKDIFLRELISNASDACDKLRYQALTKPDLLKSDPGLKISISFDPKAKTLTIADNGIGMSRDELNKNLGTIARSGTQNFLAKLTGDKEKDVNLIGQFGVGFYSGFMVADKVSVTSRKAGSKKAHTWESKGDGKFTIEEAKDEQPRGTQITLHLRDDEAEFLDKWRLSHIIKTYSDHIAFPIELAGEEGEAEVVNSASALWLRSKSEITEEQYKEFYHHIGHMADEPWLTLHNKVEGVLEFTNLLYIPSTRPFDLFHPDRTQRIKLYVKRVYITDEGVEIIPAHLRFLRGVVDSEDLPLNISRETLQHNAVVRKIRSSITKRVYSELKKKSEEAPEEYVKFWENFGACMKEGLCDAMEPREELLEVCRFASTHDVEKLTNLDDYISRMQERQKAIYYLSGDDLASLQNSPQLEGFKQRGIEVLLLTDSVDDFWTSTVHEYKGTELKSVTRAGEELEEVESKEKAEEKKKDVGEDTEALIACMKETLGEAVQEVRRSTKLTESPVCLAIPEGGMDIRMERFLIENRQLAQRTAKILEINPSHPVITKLAKDFKAQGDSDEVKDVIHILFGQASILEGETLSDVTGFSKRLNSLLEKALAA